MNEHASAWKPLIDEWVSRERRLHPDTPIKAESVRVRDSVEIDDQAFVLLTYDVDYPWPAEEDAPGESRSANTAVLQAARVRQPWIERDATRALGQLRTDDDVVIVYEHLLGPRRVFSGTVSRPFEKVQLRFEEGETVDATVVDGWFLAVAPENRTLGSVRGRGGGPTYEGRLVREDTTDMLSGMQVARIAPRSMYFSPLDVRGVVPLVQWERAGNVVVVAVCMEQYDEGGILRLRIDGARADDDLFVNWPLVTLEADGSQVASAICGEYSLADTLSMDIGFRPWIGPDVERLVVRVEGLRGFEGPVGPVTLELTLRNVRG